MDRLKIHVGHHVGCEYSVFFFFADFMFLEEKKRNMSFLWETCDQVLLDKCFALSNGPSIEIFVIDEIH